MKHTNKQIIGDCTISQYCFSKHEDVMSFIERQDNLRKRYSSFVSSGKYYASYYDYFPHALYTMNYANGCFRGIRGDELQALIDQNDESLNNVVSIT
jgi:hypothetical protein